MRRKKARKKWTKSVNYGTTTKKFSRYVIGVPETEKMERDKSQKKNILRHNGWKIFKSDENYNSYIQEPQQTPSTRNTIKLHQGTS